MIGKRHYDKHSFNNSMKFNTKYFTTHKETKIQVRERESNIAKFLKYSNFFVKLILT